MTQGKIERYHHIPRNVANLESDYLAWQLKLKIDQFVDYYNNERVHKSLDNLTPADVFHGRTREVRGAGNLVREQTLRRRRRINLGLEPLKEEPKHHRCFSRCLSNQGRITCSLAGAGA